MTNTEFKAWFEGFCESIEGRPTIKQFEKIKEKIAMIDGAPFYIGYPYRYNPIPTTWVSCTPTMYTTTNCASVQSLNQSTQDDSVMALTAAYEDGRKEAISLS